MIPDSLRLHFIVTLMVICVLQASSACAFDYYWAQPVSGSVLDPTMWSPGFVPQPLDTAIFNLGSTGYTVSLPPKNSGAQVENVIVGNDTITADLGQNVLNVDVYYGTTPAIVLGNVKGAVGNLTVKNGSLDISGGSNIGYAAGSTGTLTVDGSAGKAKFGGDTQYIGYAGNGTVAIVNGGSADVGQSYLGYQTGVTGAITVDGAGSTYAAGRLYVGESGSGTVAVTHGGAVSVGGGIVGDLVGAVGSITVDGIGSSVTDIGGIGNQGSGSLSVTGGATASAIYGGGGIGAMPGSSGTVTVDGAGSLLSNVYTVGYSGNGTLTVTNGGSVKSYTGGLAIGANSGGTGIVTLSGAGTSLTASGTTIGYAGTGILSLSAGAQMTSTSMQVGGRPATASGVTVDGAGTSLSAGAMTLLASSVPTGIVNVTGGANLNMTALDMGTSNTMTFDGMGTTGSIVQPLYSGPGDSLVVRNGALLTIIGAPANGYDVTYNGSATIDGTGSVLNVPNLMQGYPAASNLTMSHGGALNAQSIIASTPINVLSGSSLTGSTSITMNSTLTVGANSSVSTPSLQIGGNVDLSGGGNVHVAPVIPATQSVTPAAQPALPASTIQVDTGGTLTGLGTLTGSVLNEGGQVALVNLQSGATKNFNVSGDYTQHNGMLTLALGGAPANTSTELIVSGNVALSGILQLDFVLPEILKLQVGQTFNLISAGGTFSTSNLNIEIASVPKAGQIPNGFTYTTQLENGVYSLTITSVPEPATLVLAGMCTAGVLCLRPRAVRRR
jgi:fibronectin-binding autotransporter adhesin